MTRTSRHLSSRTDTSRDPSCPDGVSSTTPVTDVPDFAHHENPLLHYTPDIGFRKGRWGPTFQCLRVSTCYGISTGQACDKMSPHTCHTGERLRRSVGLLPLQVDRGVERADLGDLCPRSNTQEEVFLLLHPQGRLFNVFL